MPSVPKGKMQATLFPEREIRLAGLSPLGDHCRSLRPFGTPSGIRSRATAVELSTKALGVLGVWS